MNTLVRNTTLRFSRRFDHGFFYGPLDRSYKKIGEDDNYRRISTSRRKVTTSIENNQRLRTSFSYRRDRAKKRQIFLQSYKLGSDNTTTYSDKLCKSRKLKKAATKVKSVAASVVSFMRITSLSSCKSGLAIRAFSPTRIQRVEGILKTYYHKNVNSKGQTPDQIFAENKEKIRVNAQEWLKRTAGVVLLIATVAFAAAYTVPGGSNPDGSPVLINQTLFVVFTISDVLSLTFTLTAVVIFLSILTSPFKLKHFKESLPQKLMVGLTCLILSVTMMMLAFGAIIILMIKNKERWTKIALYTVAFLPVTILAVSYLPLYVPLMRTFHYTLGKIASFVPRFIVHHSRDTNRSGFHEVTATTSSSAFTQVQAIT